MGLNIGGNINIAGFGNVVDLNVTGPALFRDDTAACANSIANGFYSNSGFFWANGSPYVPYNDANVCVLLPSYAGNIASSTFCGANITTGNILASGNVIAAKLSAGLNNVFVAGNLIAATSNITIDPLNDGTPGGSLTILGNVSITGNLTYNDIANATTSNLTWIAAVNATTAVQASGGGLQVGNTGNVFAAWTYSQPGNVWVSSLGICANGNITANNFVTGTGTGGNISGANVITANTLISGKSVVFLNTNGLSVPVINTTSSGTRALLYCASNLTNSVDYAVGMATGTMWNSVPWNNAQNWFSWYGGNVQVANLTGAGALSVAGNITGNFILGNGSQLTGISVSTNCIFNGNSNVAVAANGNITIGSAGNSNIAVFTGTGASITGNLTVAGANSSSLSTIDLSANTANIKLGNVSNIHITGGLNGQYLQTNGNGNVSWSNIAPGALTSTVDAFSGNGLSNVYTLSVVPANINYTTVVIDGATQLQNNYSVAGNIVTLGANLPNNSILQVTTINGGTALNPLLTSVNNGNSNVIVNANSSITISSNGVANVFSIDNANLQITSNVIANFNVVGNLNSSGNLISTGNLTGFGNTAFTSYANAPSNIDINGTVFSTQATVASAGVNPAGLLVQQNSPQNGEGATITMALNQNPDPTIPGTISQGQVLGQIKAAGFAATRYAEFANIRLTADPAVTEVNDDNAPGQIIFGVTANNASSPQIVLSLNSDQSASFTGNLAVDGLQSTFGTIVFSGFFVAQIPLVQGARAIALDSNIAPQGNFGVQITGGGSNVAPIWSDGSNWFIG